jgi:dTDP-glucose pyrophosphorylase
MNLYKKNIILNSSTLREALARLNNLPSKDSLTLFVVDEKNKLLGTLTDGDIRRGLLNGSNLETGVIEIMNNTPKFIRRDLFTIGDIDFFKEKEIDLIPILNTENSVEKIIDLSKKRTVLPVDAVLMAGGEGKRLHPLTIQTPKPLLLIGGSPIIERNIDRLSLYGIDNFHLSIKYLGNQIKDHFKDGTQKDILINYIEEEKPLGTIGSVSLVKNFVHDEILVMNSDLLTNIDFEDFYKTFKNSKADLLVACIPYQVSLPYGVVETENSRVISIKEKPTYTYYSNAGIYLFKKELIELIPNNSFYNATDLIENLINTGKNVLNYPILTYWLDIGKHDDYAKAQEDIKHLKF